MRLVQSLVAVAVFSFSGLAMAQTGKFGDAGTIAPNGGVSFAFTNTSPPEGDGTSMMSLSFSPGALYFIAEGIGVGAQIVFDYSKIEDFSTSAYGIAPMAGYNLYLGESLSVMPTLSLPFMMGSFTMEVLGTSIDASSTNFGVGLDVPFLFHFGNYFIGAGPFFQMDLMSKVSADGNSADGSKNMVFGVHTMLGGWL